jgi:hypothetical protein
MQPIRDVPDARQDRLAERVSNGARTPRVAGPRSPLSTSQACDRLAELEARAAILVEGWSDQAALETLARRRGWNLLAEGVVVVPIGGATNIGKFVQALGPQGLDVRLAALYDASEERHIRRSLEQIGFGTELTRSRTETLGFFACDADLEDELIRALGTTTVERVLAAEQLRRFMGTRAGRKIRYGSLLIDALDLDHVPRALGLVLAQVLTMSTSP